MSQEMNLSFYDLTVNDANGNPVSFSQYKGCICVIVNISSKSDKAERNFKNLYLACGPLKGKGVQLLLFPCYQFGETEDFNTVSDFVDKYCLGIAELFQPIDVNGPKASVLYKFLKSQKLPTLNSFIREDFTVFMVNAKGILFKRYNSGFTVDAIQDAVNSCSTSNNFRI